MAGEKTGLDCKFYYSATALTAGEQSDYQGLTWVLCEQVANVTFTGDVQFADMNKRSSTLARRKPTLSDFSLEIELIWDSADAFCAAVLAAWLARSAVAICALDAVETAAGAQGPVGNFYFTLGMNQQLTDGVQLTVTAQHSDFGGWYTTIS